MDTMGNRIRGLRKARGLSQVELAKKIGISQGSLSDLENNVTKSGYGSTITALCSFLETNAKWLETGKGHPGPQQILEIDQLEIVQIWMELPQSLRETMLNQARELRRLVPRIPSRKDPFAKSSGAKT